MTEQRFCQGCGKPLPPDSQRCIYCSAWVESPTLAGQGAQPGAPEPGAAPPSKGSTVAMSPGKAGSPPAGGKTVVLSAEGRTEVKDTLLCYLIEKEGNERGRVFHLDKGEISIGRDSTCDVVLNDDAASGTHAKCRYKEDHFMIQDAASANGTYVNGKEIAKHDLKSGDIVKIGATVLYYLDINDGPGEGK